MLDAVVPKMFAHLFGCTNSEDEGKKGKINSSFGKKTARRLITQATTL